MTTDSVTAYLLTVGLDKDNPPVHFLGDGGAYLVLSFASIPTDEVEGMDDAVLGQRLQGDNRAYLVAQAAIPGGMHVIQGEGGSSTVLATALEHRERTVQLEKLEQIMWELASRRWDNWKQSAEASGRDLSSVVVHEQRYAGNLS